MALTCLGCHRSSSVLDCIALELILLFFFRGLSLSISSGKNRGVLVDVLGPCSSSESGRKSGWCSLWDVVGGAMVVVGEIGRFL